MVRAQSLPLVLVYGKHLVESRESILCILHMEKAKKKGNIERYNAP